MSSDGAYDDPTAVFDSPTDPYDTLTPTDPPQEEDTMVNIVKKVETTQTITLNQWVKMDLGADDSVQPPVGNDDWDAYVDLSLASATCGRNNLRYVKGRWAREIPGADDVTGTDTKAISPDIPKDSWQGTWSHGFVGEAGVKVSFWVYVGALKAGTIKSTMRIFKVDDEA
jgi:hypothetical protein